MEREQTPMTYREIKDYAERAAGEQNLALEEIDPGETPWGVMRWLTHEVLPTINRTGRYAYPEDLDQVCQHTYPLKTGRYITEPVEE
jgi:hypothetical protein